MKDGQRVMQQRTVRCQHARRQRVLDDAGDIVCETSHGDGLVAQATGGRLGHNRITGWAHAYGVHEGADHEKDADGHLRRVGFVEAEAADLCQILASASVEVHNEGVYWGSWASIGL